MRQFFFAPPVNPTFKKKHSCLRGIFGETKIHLSDSWEAKASLTRADGWAIGDFIGKNSGNGPWISQRSWSRLVGSGSLWNVEKDEKIIEHNYHTCCIYYVYIYIYISKGAVFWDTVRCATFVQITGNSRAWRSNLEMSLFCSAKFDVYQLIDN